MPHPPSPAAKHCAARRGWTTSRSPRAISSRRAPPIAPGSFDYIVAHGVYAWVPEPVRAAIMALIGHALSPHGVAYVSYNALPGGHFRMAMRDMLLHAVDGITDPDARVEKARAFLQGLVDSDAQGRVAIELFREFAGEMLNRHESVLFHDELGEVFAPQSVSEVAAAAAQAGLRYLGDSEHARIEEAFLEPGEDDCGDPERAVVRKAQTLDYQDACLFRMSLFVRGECLPRRDLDPDRMEGLWISTIMTHDAEKDEFFAGSKHLNFEDEAMKAAFRRIAAASPGRLPVAGLIEDTQRRRMFLKMFMIGHVDLHTTPAPFALESATGRAPARWCAPRSPASSRGCRGSITGSCRSIRRICARCSPRRTAGAPSPRSPARSTVCFRRMKSSRRSMPRRARH